MKSKILNKHILEELIHFESEDLNYFENAFSSDVDHIVCEYGDKDSWCTMDPSTSQKPLTVVLDLEAVDKGVYTGIVKGFYLIDININELKRYEGDQEILEKSEYYAFDVPRDDIIQEIDSPIDEVSFGYAPGFKKKILRYICN